MSEQTTTTQEQQHQQAPPKEEVPPVVAADEEAPVVSDASSSKLFSTPTIGVGMIVLLAVAALVVLRRRKAKQDAVASKRSKTRAAAATVANSVSLEDISYLVKHLHVDSSHLDVLLAVASTPETIRFGLDAHEEMEELRDERKRQDAEEAQGGSSGNGKKNDNVFDLDDAGWADEEDEDDDEEAKEKAKLAKAADEEKEKNRQALEQATGKVKAKLEGFDEGVIGQKWVEDTLASKGLWPPKNMALLEGRTFDYNGKQVSALDHPGLRRNLCMLMGRLHSAMLNSHPELLQAGSKNLIDKTYFGGAMAFRQRIAMMLEATLRTTVSLRSTKLAATVVETVAMFKIGCEHGQTEWFNNVMTKTYGTVPRLEIKDTSIETPGETEIITGDVVSVSLELTRLHAEAFTRQKVAMFQKQGIPPQIGLQTYREGWWFIVSGKRHEGDGDLSKALSINTEGVLQKCDEQDLEEFRALPLQQRLITAWPMMVANVAQKSGKVKIQFRVPKVPGKYTFKVDVMSQEFLDADQSFEVTATIVDQSSVDREPREAQAPTQAQQAPAKSQESKKDE